MTRELIRISNTTRVSSDTMVDLLAKIAVAKTESIAMILDNARCQHCKKVMAEAERLGVELLFLPTYSPNLNVIERLWNFTTCSELDDADELIEDEPMRARPAS